MIMLTDNAASKVNELITAEGEEGLALRVAVRPGGCSGFSYEMYFDTDRAADDITKDFSGVDVVVDPQSAINQLSTTQTSGWEQKASESDRWLAGLQVAKAEGY